MSNPVRQVLIDARALITPPERWAKDPDLVAPCYCVVTAVQCVSSQEMTSGQAFALLRAAIGLRPWPEDFLASWNDAPETTHADVLAAFDRAIAMAGEETEK